MSSDTKADAAENGYNRQRAAIRKDISGDQVMNHYKTWAKNYDEDVSNIVYNAPRMVAEFVEEHFSTKKDELRILDVAGGTGIGAIELRKRGFFNIDIVDGCKEMLDKAREKNVYKRLFQSFVGVDPIEGIVEGAYNLVVTCGSFVEGHLNQSCFPELIRITQKGGKILILMGESYLESVEVYKDKLEPAMEKLEDEGKWKRLRRDVIPDYFPIDKHASPNGILYLFEKC